MVWILSGQPLVCETGPVCHAYCVMPVCRVLEYIYTYIYTPYTTILITIQPSNKMKGVLQVQQFYISLKYIDGDFVT